MQRSIPKLSKITRGLCLRVMLLLFLTSGAAFAFPVREVFVSQSGTDAPGRGMSVNMPFRTIQYAVMNPPTNLGNDDTLVVYVAAGFYNENVNIPDGWPSMQLSCSVGPGRAKLIISGPKAPFIPQQGRFSAVSPVTTFRNIISEEAVVQQASGLAPAFRIGEGTDVEIVGLTIRNANDQAIAYNADRQTPFTCANFLPGFDPATMCIPSVIKIKHNIIETVGTSTGNAGDEGIVGVKNNSGVNPVNGKRASFIFMDNLVRNVAGAEIGNLGSRRAALYLQNATDTVQVSYNRFVGNSATIYPSGIRPMSNAIFLWGCRGTEENQITVYKNRIEDSDYSGIRVLSADTVETCDVGNLGNVKSLTSRWLNISYNSITGANASNLDAFGGIEIDMFADIPNTSLENRWIYVRNNTIEKSNKNAIVFNGDDVFSKRQFFVNHNIFIDNMDGGSRGYGIRNNTFDPFNPTAVSHVEAGGNWYGSNSGADHVQVVATPTSYNIAAGNQKVGSFSDANDVSIYYSPWLAGSGDGTVSPDDMTDAYMVPATWGFNNTTPKTYIAKELISDDSEKGVSPELHTIRPDMVPDNTIMYESNSPEKSVTGYISRGVLLSKNNDTINVLAGTFDETVEVDKDLYFYGNQRGVSAACASTRRLDTPDGRIAESKVVSGRFQGVTGASNNIFTLGNNKVTLDGLTIYTYRAQAINNLYGSNTMTTMPYLFKNLVVRTIDQDETGNSVFGFGDPSYSGGAIVGIENHSGSLNIYDNRFEHLMGRYSVSSVLASGSALALKNVNGATNVTRNYFEGDPSLIGYNINPNNGLPQLIRTPMSYGVIVLGSHPSGADSLNIERNYFFRPDYAALYLGDSSLSSTKGSLNNINFRYNTIDEANVSVYNQSERVNIGGPNPVPNDLSGGIETVLGNKLTNNIAIQFNHFKNNQFTSINLKEVPGSNFTVPSNFRIVYNLFNNVPGFTTTILTPSGLNLASHTYGTTGNELGVNVTWNGSGNVNARGNWWGTKNGPKHAFNWDGTGRGIQPPATFKVHYSPWMSASSLPDDGTDIGPIWNNVNGDFFDIQTGKETNYMLDCSTWGYQDRLQKDYYVEISSPGEAACQPQVAINMAKEGDIVSIGDVQAFSFENIVVCKNLVLDAPGVNISANLQDIYVLNGKRLSLRTDFTARNIYLSCNVNIPASSCSDLYSAYNKCSVTGPVLTNGYIETWTNPVFMKTLTFTGTVCEEPDASQTMPDRYVRGKLATKRLVRAGQGSDFGNMGYILGPGSEKLDSVMVTRMAGPDTLQLITNPTFNHMVSNGEVSINRSWAVVTKNPYLAGDRRLTVYWYKKEDNGVDLQFGRPWNKNDQLNNNLWTGLQPSTLSQDINPRRVTLEPVEKMRLEDTLTIAENQCGIMASLSPATPSTICANGKVKFDLTIKNGQPPYNVMIRENNGTPFAIPTLPVIPADVNGNRVYTIEFDITAPGPVNFYAITEVKDLTGCRELVNLGSARTLDVKPIPSARLIGEVAPTCNGSPVDLLVDFSAGTAPWRVMYTIGNDPTIMEATTSQDPFVLSVTPTVNASPNDQQVAVKLVGVDYGPNTCTGTIVGDAVKNITVRPTPTVTMGAIASNTTLKACQCQAPTVDVILEGKGPWQLQYSVRPIQGGTPTMDIVTLGNSNDPSLVTRTFTINPNLINPFVCPTDTYKVRLERVIDANGCSSSAATNPEATVVWVPNPTAKFTATAPVNFCEGTPAVVDVDVTGQGPWTVNYLENGVSKTRQIGTPMFTAVPMTLPMPIDAPVLGANVYNIIGVVDGGNLGNGTFCSNNTINSTLIVNINPQPKVGWTQADFTVCENGVATMEVELKGLGPWMVYYKENGRRDSVLLGAPGELGPVRKQFLKTPTLNTSYELTGVRDGNIPSCFGTVDSDDLLNITVNPAPTASLLNNNQTICSGTTVKMNVFLRGIGPWTVTYTANGTLQQPIVLGTSLDSRWGVVRSFDVTPVQTTQYCIVSVSDGTTLTPCTSLVSGSCATITVNSVPTATFAVAGPIQTCQGSLTKIPFVVSGTGPWIVKYTVTPQVGPVVTRQISYGNILSPSPSTFQIEENINFSSTVCINTISDGNSCGGNSNNINTCIQVLVGAAPSAVLTGISGNTTVACNGSPVNLKVTFAGGTGPFNIKYQIGNEPEQTVAGITTNPYVLSVAPVQSANVVLKEVALSNGGCKGTASGSVAVTVRPLPTANYTSTGGTVCTGSQFGMGLQLTGKGPWRVYYTRNSVADSVNLGTGVSPDPFSAVWSVTPTMNTCYALTGVRDANGCYNTANGEVCVNVTPAARAMFTASAPINSCIGTLTNLELSLEGVGPWNVTVLAGVTPQAFTVGTPGQIGTPTTPVLLPISVSPAFPTTYTLLSVTDNSGGNCPGMVTGNAVTVNVASAPTASIMNVGPVPTICAGQTANIMVTLTGNGPWDVTLNDNFGNVITRSGVTASPVIIPVAPLTAGTVVYTVSTVSYSGNACAVTAPSSSITGTAIVNVTAAATASVTAGSGNTCLGSQAHATIVFSGLPPFNFQYTVNSIPFTATTNNMTFDVVFAANQLGANTVAVTSVSNGGPCAGVVTGTPATINVTQGPTAVLSGNPQSVCISSPINLSVTLTGVGPFNFTYMEDPNGPTTTVTFPTAGVNNFTAVPTAFGTRIFRAVSVTDASGCPVGVASGQVSANVGTASNLTVLAVKTDASCSGGNGSITITAFVTPSCQPGQCPLEYSLDGTNWQNSNVFLNIPAGTYTPYARIIGTACPAVGNPVTVGAPNLIANINVTNITVNSANVAWPGAGSGPFRIRYRIQGETNFTVIDNINGTNVNLTGLQNNTTYDVEWYSLCGGNTSAPVISTFKTLSSGGCAIPGGVFVDDISAGTATLNWNPVPTATCYIVQWKSTNSNVWSTQTVTAGNTSFTAVNLNSSCSYQFRIRTNCTSCDPNSGTRSAYSARFTTSIPNSGCREASVVTAVEAGINNFEVYPNPNNGQFNVRFATAEEGVATITMYDVTGKEVISRQAATVEGQNEIPVEMSGYSNGVYVLKIQQGTSVVTTKVVIN